MVNHQQNSRRNFLRNTALAATAISLPQIVSASFTRENFKKKTRINKDDVILFQGDSITDASRKKDDANFNATGAMGTGYAMMAAGKLLQDKPEFNLKIYNRGISGNKVFQLAERWQKDCLDLKPNVLSILIGVNDFWHTLTSKYTGTIKTYNDDLRKLLDETKQKLPGLSLVIGEPFTTPGTKVDDKWFPAFHEYRSTAKTIAADYDAAFIPYQSVFDEAQRSAPANYWTSDGVHPTLAGAALMAHAWREVVKI